MPDRRLPRLLSLLILSGLSLPVARADVETPTLAQQQANRLSLFHDYSITATGQTAGSFAGIQGDALVNNVLDDSWVVTPDSSRGYTLALSPVVGYDSNPEARRVARGGAFVGADFNAGYNLNFGKNDPVVGYPTRLVFSYDAMGAAYEGQVSQADAFQHNLSGRFDQSLLHDSLQLHLLIDDEFTMLHDEAVLNTVDVAPGIEAFVLPQLSAELGYDYADFEYYGNFAKNRDPDADRHTFNARLHFYPVPQLRGVPTPESPDQLTDILRATLRRGTFGYAHVWNDSTGSQFRYEGDRLYVGFEGLRLPRTQAVSLDVLYSYETDRYSTPQYEGPPAIGGILKGRKRRDDINLLTFRANARLLDLPHNRGTVSTFLQWDVVADHTFTRDRRYNEFSISGGIAYRY